MSGKLNLLNHKKTNYIQETIELLEEDLLKAEHALESVISELDREIADKCKEIDKLKVARDVLDARLRKK